LRNDCTNRKLHFQKTLTVMAVLEVMFA